MDDLIEALSIPCGSEKAWNGFNRIIHLINLLLKDNYTNGFWN